MERTPEFTPEQLANHAMVSAMIEHILDLEMRVAELEKRRRSEDAASASLAHGLARETEH